MDAARTWKQWKAGARSGGERASATVEHVGLAVGVAALLALAAGGAAGEGGALARSIAAATTRAVAGEAGAGGAGGGGPASGGGASRGVTRHAENSGEIRTERVAGAQGGEQPTPLGPDDLQLSGAADPDVAWWERDWSAEGTDAGIDWQAGAGACALCIGTELAVDQRGGAGVGSGVDPAFGVGVEGSGGIFAALAAVEASVAASRQVGAATVSADGRASAVVGGQLTGTADAELSSARQGVTLEGTAVAGATARAEGRAGLELFGIAIEQGAAADGWAGAGARGVADASHEDGRIEWKFGWGAALGLGGGTEWSGAVDVRDVEPEHVRTAGRALRTGVAAAVPAVALLPDWR